MKLTRLGGENTTKSWAVPKTHKSHKGLLEGYISTKNFRGDGTFGQAELPVSHAGSPRDADVLSHPLAGVRFLGLQLPVSHACFCN